VPAAELPWYVEIVRDLDVQLETLLVHTSQVTLRSGLNMQTKRMKF